MCQLLNGGNEVGIQRVEIKPQDAAKITGGLPAGSSVTFNDAVMLFDVDSSLCGSVG